MVEFVDVNGKKQSFDEKGHFNIAFNADCMEFLRNCPDNAFHLCVCDPPYGGGNACHSQGSENGLTAIKAVRTGGGWANRLDPSKKL